MKTDEEIMKEFKTVREIAYEVKNELATYMEKIKEKEAADVAYIAMMADVDMDEIEDDEEGDGENA